MNLATRLLFRLPKFSRRLARTCIYGLVAGLVAVAFHQGIHYLYEFGLLSLVWESPKTFAIGSFVLIISTSLIAGIIVTKFAPEAAGSGIPQLKLSFWKDCGYVPLRAIISKFVAGVLTVGGGASLGREGPSVHISGGLASYVASLLGEPKQNRREAAAAGAAAGLAAAFNTPIAAVTFVLEEIIQDLNSRFLGPVLLASIVGAFTVYATLGEHPAFTLPAIGSVSWSVYVFIPVVAAGSALVGVLFQKQSLGLRAISKKIKFIPRWMMPATGALITWCVGCAVFLGSGHLGVFGLGYNDLSAALNDSINWKLAGFLLAGKLIATIACYGLGGCGGIFAPSLFFGGMTGLFLSGVCAAIAPSLGIEITTNDRLVLTVVGMTSCLGAVVRAPITSILMVFEMTHQFSIVPALMLGALISQAIGISLSKHNFYEALLSQDGHNLDHVIPPRDLQSWQQLPVSAIANFEPVVIEDLAPDNLTAQLENYPYNVFPVKEGEEFVGVLTREEAKEALQEDRPPKLESIVWTTPNTSIRELQLKLIESTTGLILIHHREGGSLIALVTLHDLLRNQVEAAKESQV